MAKHREQVQVWRRVAEFGFDALPAMRAALLKRPGFQPRMQSMTRARPVLRQRLLTPLAYAPLHKLNSLLRSFGFDFARAFRSLRALPGYRRDLEALKRQLAASDDPFPLGKLYPCLEDRFAASGSADTVYFHQDLLVARRVHRNAPRRHVDVGSRIDGFVAHVASFRPIEVLDIRPLESTIPNVTFAQADLMQPLGPQWLNSCDSVSCLHALEHFGLGRYGDPIHAEGHRTGFENLVRMLETGGKLYLSVPIGPRRIEFNAHRVFGIADVLGMIGESLRLDHFSCIDDANVVHEGVTLTPELVAQNCGCTLGCGIFELTKL